MSRSHVVQISNIFVERRRKRGVDICKDRLARGNSQVVAEELDNVLESLVGLDLVNILI